MEDYMAIDDYLLKKTFKFSDAYSVEVYDREPAWNDHLHELFSNEEIQKYNIEECQDGSYRGRTLRFKNCNKFSVPAYKPKAQNVEFCNRTQVVYVPNTDKPDPMSLEFFETEDRYVGKFIKYCLRKNFFDEKVNYHVDSYNPYRYIDWIKIHVWDNNLKKKVMTHIFESCRISTYDYNYKLDYKSSELIQPSISFSFVNYKIDMNPDND